VEQALIRLLQQMPIFGAVNEDALRFIVGEAPVVEVRQGDLFFHEGDRADSMFVLETGRVSIFRRIYDQELFLRELGAGDCFGELALMDLLPRSASVRALEDCRALQLSSATLLTLYRRHPEQFTLIYMNIGREIARRLRVADERLFQARAKAIAQANADANPSA
jgi:CRP-like cAMP-binding protein